MSLAHFTTPMFLGRMAIRNLNDLTQLESEREGALWNYAMALASLWALGGVAFDSNLKRPLRAAAGLTAAALALELLNARAKRSAARLPILRRKPGELVFEVVETIEI